jgi:hypothetical protein
MATAQIQVVDTNITLVTSTGVTVEFRYDRDSEGAVTILRRIILGPGAGFVPITIPDMERDIAALQTVLTHLRRMRELYV